VGLCLLLETTEISKKCRPIMDPRSGRRKAAEQRAARGFGRRVGFAVLNPPYTLCGSGARTAVRLREISRGGPGGGGAAPAAAGGRALRVLLAAARGRGSEESWVVGAGGRLALGFFDPPPLAWWLAWGAAHLFGSEAPFVVRLPFVLLFALTTWLMYRLTAVL